MDNVLIDDRRIHVDFSQSVSRFKWKGKGRGVDVFEDKKKPEEKSNTLPPWIRQANNNTNRNESSSRNGRYNESESSAYERKRKYGENRDEPQGFVRNSRPDYKDKRSHSPPKYSRRDETEQVKKKSSNKTYAKS